MPATVEVVELALGDRVVDVDGREEQQAHFSHLVQSVHSGGGLFRDAPDGFCFAGEVGRIHVEDGVQQLQHDFVFVVVGGVGRGDFAFLLELDTFVHQKGGIATVIKNEIGLIVAPVQRLESAPPVFFEGSPFQAKIGAPEGDSGCHIRRCTRRPHDLGWRRCCKKPNELQPPMR